MKTIHVTVNVRAAYGEAAKEATVGIYSVENPQEFEAAFMNVVAECGKRWHGPEERCNLMRAALMKFGYYPLEAKTLFASIG